MRLCTRVVAAWASPRAAAEIWKAGFGWLIIFLNGARSWSLSDLESHLRHHHHHLPQPERGGGERDLTFVRELIRLFCGHVVTAPVKTNFSFPVELSIIIWCVIANPLNTQATTCQATGNGPAEGGRQMEMIFTKVYISWAWSPVIWSRGAQWKSVFLSSKSPGDKSDLWYRQLGLSTGQWVKSDIAGYYIILSVAVHSAHTAAAAHHIYPPQWIWQTDRRPSRSWSAKYYLIADILAAVLWGGGEAAPPHNGWRWTRARCRCHLGHTECVMGVSHSVSSQQLVLGEHGEEMGGAGAGYEVDIKRRRKPGSCPCVPPPPVSRARVAAHTAHCAHFTLGRALNGTAAR